MRGSDYLSTHLLTQSHSHQNIGAGTATCRSIHEVDNLRFLESENPTQSINMSIGKRDRISLIELVDWRWLHGTPIICSA